MILKSEALLHVPNLDPRIRLRAEPARVAVSEQSYFVRCDRALKPQTSSIGFVGHGTSATRRTYHFAKELVPRPYT